MTDDVLVLPARELAIAWLNVALASAEYPAPALDRTVLIEAFGTETCRLVATETHVLLRSFVAEGFADATFVDEPLLEEAPTASWVAADLDGRMAAMCSWLVKLTKPRKDETPPRIMVHVSVVDLEPDPDEPTLMPEMAAQALHFDAEVERVTLPIIEAPYPSWRTFDQVESEAVEHLSFSKTYLGLFGRMRNSVGPARLRFAADRPTTFTAGTYPEVHGLLMPIREPDPEPEVEP